MNRKILVANWKMNPASESEAVKLARASDARNIVVSPPFPFLRAVRRVLKRASLGAQDAFWEKSGAYTGEISPTMLKKMGVRYVIIGHSERRKHLGETDAVINKKVRAALGVGLQVVLCAGESKEVRRRGLGSAKRFVAGQLTRDLKGIRARSYVTVAYEPVWAIGTGVPDDPKQSAEMARFIKKTARVRSVLYGGSVTSSNIRRILSYREIDGALVGGASLRANEFKKIITITRTYT